MTPNPDIFTQVHKGLRHALFTVCTELGRAVSEPSAREGARARLREVLHFIAHHGENEDVLLFPLLEREAPALSVALGREHRELHDRLEALRASAESAPPHELYLQACELTAHYLLHLNHEERCEEQMRRCIPVAELAGVGRKSIERTAPADQQMMLGWMLPAMAPSDAELFLSRLPDALQAVLRQR